MFRKVIVFGLFKMIQKRKEKRGSRPRVWVRSPGLVGYSGAGRHNTTVTAGYAEVSLRFINFLCFLLSPI